MSDDLNWELLDRYLAGESSPTEAAELEQWLASHPLPRRYVDALRARTAPATPPASGDWETDARWSQLAERTEIQPRPRVRPPVRLMPVASRRSPLFAIAATLALVAGSVGLWRVMADRTATSPTPAPREYATARGERAVMWLPDGTNVILGVASTLRVPATYGDGAREVYLEGQAYFDVIHDESKPFAVHAGNAIARDLGTAFDVRAYPSDSAVEVVVAEGEVALAPRQGGPPSLPVLTPGQLGRVDVDGTITLRDSVDLDHYLAWTEGRLAFQDLPLRDILPQLGRWYDLDLTLVTPSLGERRVTLSLEDAPVTQALDAIALLVDARYERHGHTVTFSPATDPSRGGLR